MLEIEQHRSRRSAHNPTALAYHGLKKRVSVVVDGRWYFGFRVLCAIV